MKNLFEIFDEKLEIMHQLVADLNFGACLTTSTDLITTSTMFEYADGVFIGEILEAIFDQVWHVTREYALNEHDQKMLKSNFDKYLTLIINSYKKTDKNELYQALSNLRYEVTKLQYNCMQTMKKKERKQTFRIED